MRPPPRNGDIIFREQCRIQCVTGIPSSDRLFFFGGFHAAAEPCGFDRLYRLYDDAWQLIANWGGWSFYTGDVFSLADDGMHTVMQKYPNLWARLVQPYGDVQCRTVMGDTDGGWWGYKGTTDQIIRAPHAIQIGDVVIEHGWQFDPWHVRGPHHKIGKAIAAAAACLVGLRFEQTAPHAQDTNTCARPRTCCTVGGRAAKVLQKRRARIYIHGHYPYGYIDGPLGNGIITASPGMWTPALAAEGEKPRRLQPSVVEVNSSGVWLWNLTRPVIQANGFRQWTPK